MRYRESHEDQGGETGGHGKGVTHGPSVFHVPGTVVGALCAVHQLDEVTCPSHITSKWRAWICSQTCLCSSFHHPMLLTSVSASSKGCRIRGRQFLIYKMFTLQGYEDKMR